MMKPVTRDEILDYVTYTEQRDQIRPAVLAAKAPRRIVVGDGTLTFLFENRDTVRYQVQEMMRVERIVKCWPAAAGILGSAIVRRAQAS